MPKPCQRVRLETGLKLDLNQQVRRASIQQGDFNKSGIRCTNNYTGDSGAPCPADRPGSEANIRPSSGTMAAHLRFLKMQMPAKKAKERRARQEIQWRLQRYYSALKTDLKHGIRGALYPTENLLKRIERTFSRLMHRAGN